MSVGQFCHRLGEMVDKAFVERELLLRSEGKVHYLQLTRGRQLVILACLGAASLYVSFSTFGLLSHVNGGATGAVATTQELAEIDLLDPTASSQAYRRSSSPRQIWHSQDSEPTIQATRARGGVGSRPTIASRDTAESKLRRLGGNPESRSARDSEEMSDFERGERLAQSAAKLEVELAMLHEALVSSSGSLEEVRRQRDFLRARVTGLERRMSEMSETQEEVLDRLTEQITYTIETFEQVLSMTGVKLSELVTDTGPEPISLAQGGPFIPGDFLAEDTPDRSFQAAALLLELQLGRFEGLQQAIRRVPLTAPLDQYSISSGFGPRTDPINGKKARHLGVDLDAPSGTPILSTGPGRVTFAGWRGRYGRMVEIDHGQGVVTRYAHLRKILVQVDQDVVHRQKIGLLGNSGRSTGPHLHYEVRVNDRPRNPMGFIKAGKYLFKDG
ncbi:MAG: peptidoglycan DD-metalloendopeptidase family protein [Pseudomonadota bacterium]